VKHHRATLAAIVAVTMLTAACAAESPSTPTNSRTTVASPPKASTSDVSAVRSGGVGHLADVRLDPQDGYDRLTFHFTDQVPGYAIGYRPLPAQADASGAEIPLPGAGAMLNVALTPATSQGWSAGERTYSGPPTVAANTAEVTEVKAAGDFEAVLTWVVGVRAKVPFRVAAFDKPPTLVIDILH